MIKLLITIITSLSVSACLTPAQQLDREIGAGQPQEYKDGYLDGCPSGQKAAGYIYAKFKKQVIRYGEDNLYKQGWDDGFQVCKSKQESLNNLYR